MIEANKDCTPSELAIKLSKEEVFARLFIINQVEGAQKAKKKLPSWFATPGIIYPPKVSWEQCSSEATAKYKAGLLSGGTVTDLTGGFGVDTFFMAQNAVVYNFIEQNKELLSIARWNMQLLGRNNISFNHADAIEFLRCAPQSELIYVDPARRDKHNNKVFKLSDCEPDIMANLDLIKSKSSKILIKTSPMADIGLILKELDEVKEVHVVAVENECKEVLYYIDCNHTGPPTIFAANLKAGKQDILSFTMEDEVKVEVVYENVLQYLYDPNVAILKAGAYNFIADRYKLCKLGKNTHLYSSHELKKEFPGRIFRVKGVFPLKDKGVFSLLPENKANVMVKNFPYSAEELKNLMKVKDGGSVFLIGTRTFEGKLQLIVAEKIT